MSPRSVAVLVLGTGTLVATAALAGPDKVAFPEGYTESFLSYSSVDREVNPAQIGELFANEVAVEGIRDTGTLPMGSVLVMEVHSAQMGDDNQPVLGDDQRRIKTGLAVIAVMQKCEDCGEEYPEQIRNGNWEYAFFNPETRELVDRDYSGCFTCHKPLESQDFVFSIDQLRQAVEGQ